VHWRHLHRKPVAHLDTHLLSPWIALDRRFQTASLRLQRSRPYVRQPLVATGQDVDTGGACLTPVPPSRLDEMVTTRRCPISHKSGAVLRLLLDDGDRDLLCDFFTSRAYSQTGPSRTIA